MPPISPILYLDNAASTPVDEGVLEAMVAVYRRGGANPSSIHRSGLRAARDVELARMRIAERLSCAPECIVFTGCATEANNHALRGVLASRPPGAPLPHMVVSAIEHPSVIGVARWLEHHGRISLTVLPVDGQARVSPAELEQALRPETVLVSVMHANNEVGIIQPIAELGGICRARGVLFHTDACQSFLKLPLDLGTLPVDLVAINAHKVHGPKGVGALYCRPGLELGPLLVGGGHENGQRAGTLNVAGIVGFGEAVVRYTAEDVARMGQLRARLLRQLRARFPKLRLNSPEAGSLCNILNVDLFGQAPPGGANGKALFQALDRRGVRLSASSACHSTKLTPSPILLAMGISPEAADRALRISLGRFTTADDIDAFVTILADVCAGFGAPEGEALP